MTFSELRGGFVHFRILFVAILVTTWMHRDSHKSQEDGQSSKTE